MCRVFGTPVLRYAISFRKSASKVAVAKWSFIGFIAFLTIGYYLHKLTVPPQLPELSLGYWRSGQTKIDDQTIKPFKFNYSETDLIELKNRLGNTRSLVPSYEGVGFKYGCNTDYLNSLLEFWKTSYSWKEREPKVNKLPQFTTQIGGLNIHFIHAKPNPTEAKGKQVLPLLLIHGWPNTAMEFNKIIPMLTTPRPDADFVFEVVAPSMPGFGYSEAPSKEGLDLARIGLIMDQVMARLGFSKYYLHAGDWGALVGVTQAILLPEKVLGYHSTLCSPLTVKSIFYMVISYLLPKFFVEESKQDFYVNQIPFLIEESGYFHIQATEPDTLGIAFTDSPIGLAAYMLKRFSTGTNRTGKLLPDGGLKNLDKLELLDNIMVYWLTNTITTASRIYTEGIKLDYLKLGIHQNMVNVPSACIWFDNEIIYFPKVVLEGTYTNLVTVSHASGGHFSSLEKPELLSEDIWNFLKILRTKNKQL